MIAKNTAIFNIPGQNIPKQKVCSTWIFDLLYALPGLLVDLVTEKFPPSLERMQLVGFDITLHDNPAKTNALKWVKKYHHEERQFFRMIGELYKENKPFASVAIIYFLRGERQYYLPEKELLATTLKTLPAIHEYEVKEFFLALDQHNDLWSNPKLSKLNGHKTPFVPSQMVLALMLGQAFSSFLEARNFSLVFYRNAEQDTPLTLVTAPDKQILGLATPHGLCAAITILAQEEIKPQP
jgi:hypothetical protein